MAGVSLRYKLFKKQVLENANYQCENIHCDADANQIHHFLKTSTFPEYKTDPDNGMAICGSCHSEIERRIRQNENWQELIPMNRIDVMILKTTNPDNPRRIK